MPSDDTTVATQADFVPMAVGNTDRVRSVVSVSAHDGFSHHLRSGMQQGQLSVLAMLRRFRVCYAMLCLSATRPSSYRGHRAIGTIAVSTVTVTVTSAVTL